MFNHIDKSVREKKKEFSKPIVSSVLSDGTLIETIYQPDQHKTLFCIANGKSWHFEENYQINQLQIKPYSPDNNLIKNGVVLLPDGVEEYKTTDQLLEDIQSFIHRYVDVSPVFEKTASYYVLFSWVFDSFNELPYLRVRGDYGSGKTRFLMTVGSICYKPIFTSGASTTSPLFRILDTFRGTLIIDESDFRLSDEKAELIKILNNGTTKGFPVLRSEVTNSQEYNPRSFAVFGPKLVATRGAYDDQALESRFLTEETGQRNLREDIPINLPDQFHEEAKQLRNKLLLFRIRNYLKVGIKDNLVDRTLEPRLNQIFIPLLSIIEDTETRNDILGLAKQVNQELITERGICMEGQVLEIIRDLKQADHNQISVKDITEWFIDRFGNDYNRKITTRWIGFIIRKKLNIKTLKSNGVFSIPLSEEPKLNLLFKKFGLENTENNDGHPPHNVPEVPDIPNVP